jgi:hypothetical protein
MPDSGISLEQLVEGAEIEEISFFEISAIRNDSPTEASGGDDDVFPSYQLDTGTKDDGAGFRVRIRTEIDVALGRIVTDLAVTYLTPSLDANEVGPGTLLDFVNNVSVMTLVPYNRQAIADISQRIFGATLTMPMIKRGELEFHLSDAEPQ